MPKREFPDGHLSKELFDAMSRVEPYPAGVIGVPEQLPRSNFFPGGAGVWCGESNVVPPMPIGGVMILGQDFHTRAGYEEVRKQTTESFTDPTWRNLLGLLDNVGIDPSCCFFSNVYMGLREADPAVGPFPGVTDAEFVTRCRNFFLRQLEVQEPRLILALGQQVLEFLAPLDPELQKVWAQPAGTFRERDERGISLIERAKFADGSSACTVASLLHPSLRGLNLRHRKWRNKSGHEAEVALCKEAMKISGLL